MCYTETPVRIAEGKGAEGSDHLNTKTPVEGVLDKPCMCRRREACRYSLWHVAEMLKMLHVVVRKCPPVAMKCLLAECN